MTLKEYLEARNLSDAEMARRVGNGCTARAIKSYRYFYRIPRPERMHDIERATNGAVKLKDWMEEV
jgi:hypothetical protein